MAVEAQRDRDEFERIVRYVNICGVKSLALISEYMHKLYKI